MTPTTSRAVEQRCPALAFGQVCFEWQKNSRLEVSEAMPKAKAFVQSWTNAKSRIQPLTGIDRYKKKPLGKKLPKGLGVRRGRGKRKPLGKKLPKGSDEGKAAEKAAKAAKTNRRYVRKHQERRKVNRDRRVAAFGRFAPWHAPVPAA